MAKLERTDKPVSVLLEEMKDGILGLPEIQRNYVWLRPQARDLIDSLYREYPSGLILLWKPKELPVLRNFTAGKLEDREPEKLVLDGQQRLTSLKKVFNGEIEIYFNVEEEAFQIYSSKLKANPLWVSVSRVLGDGAIPAWRFLKESMTEKGIKIDEKKADQYLERLHNLQKIKEYRYPVMIIYTDDYEEITESFIRVNSKGTRLKEAELAMAQLAFHWPGALVEEFSKALGAYEDVGFDLEARFLMRCYVAISTGQCRFKFLSGLWEKKQIELEEIWQTTRKAVDHAINFLKNNAGIESVNYIPSINALVPMVGYLSSKNGRLSNEEINEMLFWFFEATIQGRFTGSPETKIDQDLKAIRTDTPLDDMIRNLRHDIASPEITAEMIEGKYQNHSFLPLLFAISRRKNAKDWFTGTILSSTNVGPEHQLELHHIFPRGLLKEMKEYETREIDDISNIVFLSQKANRTILATKPEVYLPGIEHDRLISQHVPMDSSLWQMNRYREFLASRRKLLVEAINQYMGELQSGKEFLWQTQEGTQSGEFYPAEEISGANEIVNNNAQIPSSSDPIVLADEPWLKDGKNWHLYECCSNRTRELLLSLEKVIQESTEATGPEYRQRYYVSYKIGKSIWIRILTGKDQLGFEVKIKHDSLDIEKIAHDLHLLKFNFEATQKDKVALGSSVEIFDKGNGRSWILIRMKDDFNLDAVSFSGFLREAKEVRR